MRLISLLPRSLVGRVFALYAATLSAFVLIGLGLFLQHQYENSVRAASDDARTMFSVLVPMVSDSAVIGDYDTIQRQLDRAIKLNSVAEIRFLDVRGALLKATDQSDNSGTPRWLTNHVARLLLDRSEPVEAGGTGYGTLTLHFSAEQIAHGLWHDAIYALSLAAFSLLGGVLLIRQALVSWLGHLDRIGQLGQALDGGQTLAREALAGDAPLEFRKTFEVLDRAASSLQAHREQAQATLEAIDDAVLSCDLDGRVMLANSGAQRLLGLPAKAIVGHSLSKLLPELAEAGLTLDADATQRRWQHRELLRRAADGSQHVLDSNGFPIVDADGTTVGQVLALRDVTEQHRLDRHLRQINATRDAAVTRLRVALERSPVVVGTASRGKDDLQVVSDLVSRLVQSLQERNEQLDAIFALSPDGFVSFDDARVVRYASPGFCRITGLSADMVVGVDEDVLLFRMLSRSDRKSRLTSMAMLRDSAVPDGERGPTQIELQRPQHRVVTLALHQSQSGVVSQVLHLRDVTHESVVDRMKTEFLTTAAHELRTPMVSIFGFVELLLMKDPPEARRKHMLDVVHRQCKVMIELVNELLDLSRIEARRDIDFAYRQVDLGAVVAEVVEGFHLPDGRQSPVIDWPAHTLHARLDLGKMQQAVRNVISNAYKYSPQGGEVRVRFVDETMAANATSQRLGIVVQDQGIGMTPEQLQRVGERFYRADASGNIPGTGLGMRLVREVITLMGGSLELQSTPGKGTTVTLWVPAELEPEVAPAALV